MDIEIEDALRPQSTFGYKQDWSTKPYEFPDLYIKDSFPIKNWNPVDTYAEDHNARFQQRYLQKEKIPA